MRLEVVELQVNNWDKILDWWVEKFGLKVVAREDGHRFALLAGDDGAMVGILGGNGQESQKFTPYFRVESIDNAVANLKTKSVDVDDIEVRHWGKQARVKDPEGNVIYLYEEN